MLASSRRDFLQTLGGFALLPWRRTEPQTILYNANMLTIDTRNPRAQAVAIADGRFLAVGSNDEIRALYNSRVAKVDLQGATVLPGFIDAHTHPCYAGLRHLRQVDCDLRSISDIQAAVRQRASQTPPGAWVLGFKYDDTKTSEGRPLTREDLDAAAPSHPVRIEHRGGHTAYVNSLAFKMAGVSETTPDPAGGRFDRDPSTSRLNGRISENARQVILRYRNSPALLLWSIGNEMETGQGDDPAVWQAVQEIAALAHQLDPNHPTMTVVAELGGSKIRQLHALCPAVDIVGINSYAGASSVPQRYRAAGGTKPYVLTEFGPPGPWGV